MIFKNKKRMHMHVVPFLLLICSFISITIQTNNLNSMSTKIDTSVDPYDFAMDDVDYKIYKEYFNTLSQSSLSTSIHKKHKNHIVLVFYNTVAAANEAEIIRNFLFVLRNKNNIHYLTQNRFDSLGTSLCEWQSIGEISYQSKHFAVAQRIRFINKSDRRKYIFRELFDYSSH